MGYSMPGDSNKVLSPVKIIEMRDVVKERNWTDVLYSDYPSKCQEALQPRGSRRWQVRCVEDRGSVRCAGQRSNRKFRTIGETEGTCMPCGVAQEEIDEFTTGN